VKIENGFEEGISGRRGLRERKGEREQRAEGRGKEEELGDATCALERVQEGNKTPRVTKSRGSGYLAPLIVAARRGGGCSVLRTVGGSAHVVRPASGYIGSYRHRFARQAFWTFVDGAREGVAENSIHAPTRARWLLEGSSERARV
jgi:hypothetical protein